LWHYFTNYFLCKNKALMSLKIFLLTSFVMKILAIKLFDLNVENLDTRYALFYSWENSKTKIKIICSTDSLVQTFCCLCQSGFTRIQILNFYLILIKKLSLKSWDKKIKNVSDITFHQNIKRELNIKNN